MDTMLREGELHLDGTRGEQELNEEFAQDEKCSAGSDDSFEAELLICADQADKAATSVISCGPGSTWPAWHSPQQTLPGTNTWPQRLPVGMVMTSGASENK